MRAKITQIGNSLGLILPKEVLKELNVKKGDDISLYRNEDGYVLSAYDEKIQKEMAVVDEMIVKHRNLFRKLSDS